MAAETVDSTSSLLNINMVNITKLTATNYMTWSLQVHSHLNGYDLAGFFDGSSVPPDHTTVVNEQPTPNPAYAKWRRQDKLIYSALLGTLSSSIHSVVSKTTSAAEMWKKINATYASPSWGHIQQLRIQLKHYTKGDQSIDVYLQGLTTRFDQLALLGKPVEHEAQIEFLLDGLPDEYKSVIDQMEGRDTPPTITEVHEKLLNKEAKMLAMNKSLTSVVPITANVAAIRSRSHQDKSNPRHQTHWNTGKSQHHSQPQRYDNRLSKGYQGRCQLCGVFGHSAKRCTFLQQHQQVVTNGLLPTTFRPWQPRANMAVMPSNNSTPWLMDSGVTHHMTSDFANLAVHQPYQVDYAVLLGDGSGSQLGGPIAPRQDQG
ncbi:PREDICTED: uncharacterized protein LOC104779696 [Camelina sativa]|uniref:Uncharacterized protein LOC104779696 n=1 Tax=Camelina sativa TaxID=90675 RepID=A0ABM0YKH5_CAMSA|nr:PREDICTED: uncharacterized protein LOC104779696 [Camelina sativa]